MKRILYGNGIFMIILLVVSMLSNSSTVYAAGGNPYGGHTPVDTGLVNIEGLYFVGIILFFIGFLLTVYGYLLKGKFKMSNRNN